MQVEAGMCRKSRDGQNTAKTDAKCDTHRKTPKKTMRNGELSMFLDSAARRLWHFLLENTANTDAKTKPKFSFGRAKCQNSSFSTCQQRNRHTPRGGRCTCCQQQLLLLLSQFLAILHSPRLSLKILMASPECRNQVNPRRSKSRGFDQRLHVSTRLD